MKLRRFAICGALFPLFVASTVLANPPLDAGVAGGVAPTMTFGPAARLPSTSSSAQVTLSVDDPNGSATNVYVTLEAFPADLELTACLSSGCSAMPGQFIIAGSSATTASATFTLTSAKADHRIGTVRAAVHLGAETYYAYVPVQTGAAVPTRMKFVEDLSGTIPSGKCIGPRNIVFMDAKGHVAFPDQTTQVMVAFNNGLVPYVDPQCSTSANTGGGITPRGAIATFWFKVPLGQSSSITINASATNYQSPAQQQVSVQGNPTLLPHLMAISPTRVLGTGTGLVNSPKGCSEPIFVQLQDASGAPVADTQDVLINLGGSVNSEAFADPDCSTPISKLSFQNQVTLPIYFSTGVAKQHLLGLSTLSGSYEAISVPVISVGGKASQVLFTRQPGSSTVNTPVAGPPRIALGDVDGNVVPPPGSAYFTMAVLPSTLGLSGTTSMTQFDPNADTVTFTNLLIGNPSSSAQLSGMANLGTTIISSPSNPFSVSAYAVLQTEIEGSPAPRCGQIGVALSYGPGPLPGGGYLTVRSGDASGALVTQHSFGTLDVTGHQVSGQVRAAADGGTVSEYVVYTNSVRDSDAVLLSVAENNNLPTSYQVLWDSALPSLTKSNAVAEAQSIQAGGAPVNVKVNLLDDCGEPLQVAPDVPVVLKAIAPLEIATALAATPDPSQLQGQVKLSSCPVNVDTVQFKVVVNGKPLVDPDAGGSYRLYSLKVNCASTVTPSVDLNVTSEVPAVDLGTTTHFTVQATVKGDAQPAAFTFNAPGFTLLSVDGDGATISGNRVVLNSARTDFVVEARADEVPAPNAQGAAVAQISVSAEDSAANVIAQSNVTEIEVHGAKVNLGCSATGGSAAVIAMLIAAAWVMRRRPVNAVVMRARK